MALLLFGTPDVDLPGGYSHAELSGDSPIKRVLSFPQELVMLGRATVLIKGIAKRLGTPWALADKWAPACRAALAAAAQAQGRGAGGAAGGALEAAGRLPVWARAGGAGRTPAAAVGAGSGSVASEAVAAAGAPTSKEVPRRPFLRPPPCGASRPTARSLPPQSCRTDLTLSRESSLSSERYRCCCCCTLLLLLLPPLPWLPMILLLPCS